MAKISLAKALKLKNRLAGRLVRVQSDIEQFNSVLMEQKGKVNIDKLFTEFEEITNQLINLKTVIARTNQDIQNDLIQLGEIKSQLSWFSSLNTRDGKERHGYQNTDIVYVAHFTKEDVDVKTRQMESLIDQLQDKIDEFNHSTKIEVPDRALDLAS